MKKVLVIIMAAVLVSGVAFADGGKKKTKTSCNKHEGKTCSKQDMKKDDKTAAPATKN
jgi:hypothetical protein